MRLVPCIAFLLPLAGQVEHHHPRSAEEYAQILNDPKPDVWQKPHEVVMALELRREEKIADIGAGTGYFSLRLARHAGTVYAVDIDQKLLDIAGKGAPSNHKTILATPRDPHLPHADVDTIFFCDVLHHITDRPSYYAKLKQALKPRGRIVIIDFHQRPLPVGPPVEMKISAETVEAELAAAGFRLVKSFDFLDYQYFQVYRAAP